MNLSLKQIRAIQEACKRFSIWVGAVRSGKTFSSILKLIDLIKHGPPGSVMIIGVNRDSIQRNVLQQLYALLGFSEPSSKSTETKLYGRHVYFVGAHDESAVRRIQGSTLAIAYVDEATCIPEPFWRMLLSRLSVPGAQLLATCNPEGPAHWLKKNFVDRSNELDLIYWNFTLDDNPSLNEKYKHDIKNEYTGMWYKRYILGEWAVSHGLIYDGFDQDNLYENPRHNPSYYIVGIDYGTTNPTAAVLCAVNTQMWPQISIEKEYYYDASKSGRSKSDDELAEDIKHFCSWHNISAIYVDPAAASFKVALRKHDLPVIDANNDVVPGVRTVSTYISNKNIVIHKSCKTLIEHIQSYSWDHKAADRGEDKPLKQNDHICVTGETKIWIDGCEWKIKDAAKLHREIFMSKCKTFDGRNFVYKNFINPKKTGKNKKILKLTLKNGKELRATEDHQVLTKRGYVEMCKLMQDDEVLCYY